MDEFVGSVGNGNDEPPTFLPAPKKTYPSSVKKPFMLGLVLFLMLAGIAVGAMAVKKGGFSFLKKATENCWTVGCDECVKREGRDQKECEYACADGSTYTNMVNCGSPNTPVPTTPASTNTPTPTPSPICTPGWGGVPNCSTCSSDGMTRGAACSNFGDITANKSGWCECCYACPQTMAKSECDKLCATPTPIPPTATPTKVPCNGSCTNTSQCATDYCFNGSCRKSSCSYDTDCDCFVGCGGDCGGITGQSCDTRRLGLETVCRNSVCAKDCGGGIYGLPPSCVCPTATPTPTRPTSTPTIPTATPTRPTSTPITTTPVPIKPSCSNLAFSGLSDIDNDGKLEAIPGQTTTLTWGPINTSYEDIWRRKQNADGTWPGATVPWTFIAGGVPNSLGPHALPMEVGVYEYGVNAFSSDCKHVCSVDDKYWSVSSCYLGTNGDYQNKVYETTCSNDCHKTIEIIAACSNVAITRSNSSQPLKVGDTVTITVTFPFNVEDVGIRIKKDNVFAPPVITKGSAATAGSWTTTFTVPSAGTYQIDAFVKIGGVWQ